MHQQLVIFLFLMSAILCESIAQRQTHQNHIQAIQLQNLTFENVTGRGVTQQMINAFIDLANYASVTYRQDLQKNIKYIKYRMDQMYGSSDDNFYIFIQIDQVITNRYFWVSVDSIYASFSGINKIYPKWSYLFARNYGNKNIVQYTFINNFQIGSGVSQFLFKQIISLIYAEQTSDVCLCGRDSLQKISKGVQDITSNAWTVICDNKGVTYSLFRTFKQKYLNIKGKLCYFTMYEAI